MEEVHIIFWGTAPVDIEELWMNICLNTFVKSLLLIWRKCARLQQREVHIKNCKNFIRKSAKRNKEVLQHGDNNFKILKVMKETSKFTWARKKLKSPTSQYHPTATYHPHANPSIFTQTELFAYLELGRCYERLQKPRIHSWNCCSKRKPAATRRRDAPRIIIETYYYHTISMRACADPH